MSEALIELKSIAKAFGGVQALKGLDFALGQGEVAALLGDNGAGKSTLIKIISGLHKPDEGSLVYEGQAIDFRRYNVAAARRLGIETVYQDKALGDQQPLWRNLFMGRHLKNRWGLIDVRREKEIAAGLIKSLGLSGAGIAPDTPAGLLSGGERQGLAIGRAMHFKAKVLILDEPTTALAIGEVDRVLEFTRKVRDQGGAVIFITHSLDHAWAVADRFVVMARGRVFGRWNKAELTLDELSQRLREALR